MATKTSHRRTARRQRTRLERLLPDTPVEGYVILLEPAPEQPRR